MTDPAENLETMIEGAPRELAASAGLDGNRGPYRLKDEERPPTTDAWKLAFQLTERVAIPAIEQLVARTGLANLHNRWPIKPRGALDPTFTQLGLALVGAFSQDAIEAFARVRLAERLHQRLPIFKAHHKQLRTALGNFILLERTLWLLAASESGQQLEIPYAIRFALIEWAWHPHFRQDANALCIRCGGTVKRRYTIEHSPRCERCRRETAKDREWPELAIAPASAGKWWLHCQADNCGTPARGDRRTRYCHTHKKRNTTPTKR